jgi:hypothetical protein
VTRAAFRQVDVTRALRAAKAAGVAISRYEIDKEGKITVFGGVAPSATHSAEAAEAALIRWEIKHGSAKQGRVPQGHQEARGR